MRATPFQPTYTLTEIPNPGMVTPEEEQLYFHLARTFWNEDRFYMEFGPWLGRSTTRICQGLEAAAPRQWRLNCYDLFRWHGDHIPKAARGGMPAAMVGLKEGDSFREAFLTLMGDFRGRITTYEGAVADAASVLAGAFPPSAKLGVLFVDASKGWDNAQLLRAVARNLTPGTRIVFQDFFMNTAATLQLLLMLLPQLAPETTVTDGGSVVFQVVGEISPDDPLLGPRGFKTLTVSTIEAACERLRATIPEEKYDEASLALTLPLVLWKRGFRDESHQAAERVRLTGQQRDALGQRLQKHAVLNIAPFAELVARAPA